MLKVIGIGNTLRGDDGIGPAVIKELKKIKIPDCIQLLDIGSDALSILDHFEKEQRLIIIDCANMDKSPGDVIKFEMKDSNLPILDKAISIHGFGFSEVFNIASNLYKDIKCTVIGIQPKALEFNTGLSEEIKSKIPSIIKMVVKETNKYVKKNNHN